MTNIPLRSRSNREWLVHPLLREKMVADARARDTSLSDLAIRILSDHFSVEYTMPDSTRSSSAGGSSEQLMIRNMPPELKRAISFAHPMGEHNDGIRSALCAHYRLEMPAPPRRGRAHAAA